MGKPTANLRLFVAIHPPEVVAKAMLTAMGELELPPHRPTALNQVHLTLQFIGDIPAKQLDETIESVERAAAGLRSFQLKPARLISLPERGPARLVAAETDAPPTLLELHRRLVTRLARQPRDRKDERFRPHLTLCRFRLSTRGVRIYQTVEIELFVVDRITLMRSTLTAQGAAHHEVRAYGLAE